MLVWILLKALCVFVIAAVSIGMVSGSLARRPRRSVYDLEEAVEFVADRLPDELTATVSYDDVRSVLLFHRDYLANKGIASARTPRTWSPRSWSCPTTSRRPTCWGV